MPEPPKDEHTRKSLAHRHGGAGGHEDRRTRRRRTRREADRWSKYDQEEKS